MQLKCSIILTSVQATLANAYTLKFFEYVLPQMSNCTEGSLQISFKEIITN